MAKTRKLAEVQESEWTQAVHNIIGGAILLIVAGILLYSVKYWFRGSVLQFAQILFALGVFAGLGIIGAAIYRGVQARKLTGVAFPCPYCDAANLFEAEPTEDFDCESCNRTVHFEGGQPTPVRTVICPFCNTEHRVAANVMRYVCDRCNRPLEIGAEKPGSVLRTPPADISAGLMQNYDVLLVAVDRRQENEVALKLQNLLVVNLPEARRLMGTASSATPLIVGHDLPQRKAETIRRQLQDLGATATLRPTGAGARPASRTR